MRSCYHEDATDSHGSFHGTVSEYLDWVWHLLEGHTRTMHLVANQIIELRGDRAHSETYGIVFHEGERGNPKRNLTIGFRYLDRFEKREDRWAIARRVGVSDWCRVFGPETLWEIPASFAQGARGEADPLYESRSWLDE